MSNIILANAYAINLVFKYTSLQKKFDEIRLQGNLCFPVRYISLIKKKTGTIEQIWSAKFVLWYQFFLKCKKRYSHLFIFSLEFW